MISSAGTLAGLALVLPFASKSCRIFLELLHLSWFEVVLHVFAPDSLPCGGLIEENSTHCFCVICIMTCHLDNPLCRCSLFVQLVADYPLNLLWLGLDLGFDPFRLGSAYLCWSSGLRSSTDLVVATLVHSICNLIINLVDLKLLNHDS